MDVTVTIEVINGMQRVRFERGIPPLTDFAYANLGHMLFVHAKGVAREKYDDALGTDREAAERDNLKSKATEAMPYVRWLK